jgi:hypothetical protein
VEDAAEREQAVVGRGEGGPGRHEGRGGHDAGLQGRGGVLVRLCPGRVGLGPWRLRAGAREGREREKRSERGERRRERP